MFTVQAAAALSLGCSYRRGLEDIGTRASKDSTVTLMIRDNHSAAAASFNDVPTRLQRSNLPASRPDTADEEGESRTALLEQAHVCVNQEGQNQNVSRSKLSVKLPHQQAIAPTVK